MWAKLGLSETRPDDAELIDDLLALMHTQSADYTSFLRALSPALTGAPERARSLLDEPGCLRRVVERWRARLAAEGSDPETVAASMDRLNPIYIPRNHLVEEALAFATAGDLGPFERLVAVIVRPFEERPGLERYAAPDPDAGAGYRTFCGT
jgi:uncharacterized protein YdiU (UPF0061 family)